MKKLHLVVLVTTFLSVSLKAEAQTLCHSASRQDAAKQYIAQKSSWDPEAEYHIPVNVISFADQYGNFESLSKIQQGLDFMVDDFSPMNIFLYPSCINEVNDTYIPTQSIMSTGMDSHINANYNFPDAITIFVFGPAHAASSSLTGGIALGPGLGRYIYAGGNYPYEVSVRAVETHLFSHEMGHIFGLEHTFRASTSTDPVGPGFCHELVNGSNCTDCGDFVCGTPASYGLAYTNLSDCSEPTAEYDLNSDLYTPITTNLMDYTTSSCMGSFVMGNGDQYVSQESRMKFFLVNDSWLSGLEVFSLPTTISVCDGNFQPICGPQDEGVFDYTVQWYYNDPINHTSVLVSSGLGKNGPCYTPTQYGSYTAIITDQSGCSYSQTVNVVEGFGPEVVIDDYFYCQKKGSPFGGVSPTNVGCAGPYADALSYSWTYDDLLGGGPFSLAYNQYQIPNQGDGVYCVTILWSDENAPSLLGCTSVACFEVKECCQPNPIFTMDWVPSGTSSTLTVQNDPLYTHAYDMEEFILYKNCDGTGWVLSGLPAVVRTTNFNDPVVFSGLDELCDYKVVHRVSSNCLQSSFEFAKSVSGVLRVAVFPNPAEDEGAITIKMLSHSEEAKVVIYEIITGRVVYQATLEEAMDLILPENTLPNGSYYLKATNRLDVTTQLLIVR